jgi:hypothetical protein
MSWMYALPHCVFTVGAQQCLPVTAASAFMRVAGGPHSAMHVSAIAFFHRERPVALLLSTCATAAQYNGCGQPCLHEQLHEGAG